jgi:hypothetical protein
MARQLVGHVALLLVGLLVVVTSPRQPVTLASAAETPGQGGSCPLPIRKQIEAVAAFEEMMPVFRHPRCTNCHGGVNPSVPFAQGGHRGGARNAAQLPRSCEDCHGLLPGWRVPGQPLHFTTKTNQQLCKFFKQLMPEGPGIFIEHISFEPNLPKFIEQAFKGDKALNALGEVTLFDDYGLRPRIDPPPGTHADLIAQATAWGTAVGRGWRASPECGCVVKGAWIGTVTARGEFVNAGIAGTMRVTSHATVVLEPMETPSYSSGRGVRNYRGAGGRVRWDALVSGACRGNAGGSMPLDSLDVDGHPMIELRLEDVGNGATGYQPTTGSWPDRWGPVFNVQCQISGTTVTLPTTNLLPTWWHYNIPDPPTTTDPDRLKGSYRWEVGPGSVVIWEWDLSRTP